MALTEIMVSRLVDLLVRADIFYRIYDDAVIRFGRKLTVFGCVLDYHAYRFGDDMYGDHDHHDDQDI